MDAMKKIRPLKNDDGSLMIVSVVILVLLTIAGVSATRTSSVEMQIAGNERTYKENLYKAEAAAMESARRLEDEDLNETLPEWLKGRGYVDEHNDLLDAGFRQSNGEEAEISDSTGHDAAFLASSEGIASGSSLDLRRSTVHEYAVYGWGIQGNGLVVVKLGYRKAF
jgi:type IV pilus assembly protein PilX